MERESREMPPEAEGIKLEQVFGVVREYFSKNAPGWNIIYKFFPKIEDTEEISNDLLLSLWKKRNTNVVQPNKLDAYLARAAKNFSISELRKQNLRRYGKTLELDEYNLTDAASVNLQHNRGEIKESIKEFVEQVLLKIPAYQAKILRLRYLEDIDDTELVGVATGAGGEPLTTLVSVRGTLKRARESFRAKAHKVGSKNISIQTVVRHHKSLSELFKL